MTIAQVKYIGATPGVDSNVYVLFSSVLSELGGRAMAASCSHKVNLDLLAQNIGTLKWYKSQDRGVTWNQIGSESITPVANTSVQRDYIIEALADFKLEWTNGGSAQNPWVV